MKPTYEEVTTDLGDTILKRTDEDGKVWWIPMDETNSDYQAYLNPVEHLTEIPTNQPTCVTKIAWYNANRLTLPRLQGTL